MVRHATPPPPQRYLAKRTGGRAAGQAAAGIIAASLSYDQAAVAVVRPSVRPSVRRSFLPSPSVGVAATALRRPNGRCAASSARSLLALPPFAAAAAAPARASSVIANDHIHISAPTNGSAPGAAAADSYHISKFISSPAHSVAAAAVPPATLLQFGRRGREASLDHIRGCSYNISDEAAAVCASE